jgi:hypothetical protein
VVLFVLQRAFGNVGGLSLSVISGLDWASFKDASASARQAQQCSAANFALRAAQKVNVDLNAVHTNGYPEDLIDST